MRTVATFTDVMRAPSVNAFPLPDYTRLLRTDSLITDLTPRLRACCNTAACYRAAHSYPGRGGCAYAVFGLALPHDAVGQNPMIRCPPS